MQSRRKSLYRDHLQNPTLRSTKGTHAGLWLDKYIVDQERKDNGTTDRDQERKATSSRNTLVKETSELPISPAYAGFFERWRQALASYGAHTQQARVTGRMIVGLGSESVLETSVMLHRTYGVPYIPGSALKGLAASYARQKFEGWQESDEYYQLVFGNTNEMGYITFFDALYIPGTGYNGRALYPDIITVHHPGYYQSNEPPADWDSPTPIPFLSATGNYLLALAATDLQDDDNWLTTTFSIIEQALKERGIGAKTSSGYGRMECVQSKEKPITSITQADPEMERAESLKREVEALKDVVNQMYGYYQKWQQLPSKEARLLLGHAIIEKVRQAGREKASEKKAWYQEIVAFLNQS